MKKMILISFICFFTLSVFSQNTEKEDIKKVIISAYVEGIHNLNNTENIAKGFHPCFVLLGVSKDNTVWSLPIYTWIEKVEVRKKENPEGPESKTECKFPLIDVTGNAAVAKIELYKESKKIFTDYLSLYKFDEGWRIVSKIYQSHK